MNQVILYFSLSTYVVSVCHWRYGGVVLIPFHRHVDPYFYSHCHHHRFCIYPCYSVLWGSSSDYLMMLLRMVYVMCLRMVHVTYLHYFCHVCRRRRNSTGKNNYLSAYCCGGLRVGHKDRIASAVLLLLFIILWFVCSPATSNVCFFALIKGFSEKGYLLSPLSETPQNISHYPSEEMMRVSSQRQQAFYIAADC